MKLFARITPIAVALSLLGGPADLQADNGDVLQVSTVLEGIPLSDLAFDPSAVNAFWVLGEQSGEIYRVSRELSSVLGTIPNPHGPAVFPIPVLSVGIAYRASSDTLFVLGQRAGSWEIKELRKSDGAELNSFNLTPPDPQSASIRGLTYDTANDALWYLDTNNDVVVRTDLAAADGSPAVSSPLPGADSDNSRLRGEGISFTFEGSDPFLYVSHGDIFTQKPSRIVQVTPSGTCTGVEVPLRGITMERITGIEGFRVAQQRRFAVIAGDSSLTDKLVEIEQIRPTLPPPTHLQCSLTLNGQVLLDWNNNGNRSDGSYGGDIQILRDGVPVTNVPGNRTSFIDSAPAQGSSEYSLRASGTAGGEFSPPSFPCQTTVGPGGLVRWTLFPGDAPFDVATNPATGDVFVTDPVGIAGEGRILRFDSELRLLGEIPSPWMNPGPITFVPHIEVEIPFAGTVVLDNVLAVGSADPATATQARLIDLNGDAQAPAFRLNMKIPDARIGGMTFLPETSEFAVLEETEAKIVILDRNGLFSRECKPPEFILPTPLSGGFAYDQAQDTFLALFADGFARELFNGGDCLPTTCDGCSFSLSSLGEGFDTPGFFGGIAVANNSLFVCGKESGAIFQVFIFPSGPPFVRGDANRNDVVAVDDVVVTADYLFSSGTLPGCLDSVDGNDDGILDISDPVYVLFFLFLQGPPPPAPYPNAGDDPTFRDSLGCGDA